MPLRINDTAADSTADARSCACSTMLTMLTANHVRQPS